MEIHEAEETLSSGEQRLAEIEGRIQAKISKIVKDFEATA